MKDDADSRFFDRVWERRELKETVGSKLFYEPFARAILVSTNLNYAVES